MIFLSAITLLVEISSIFGGEKETGSLLLFDIVSIVIAAIAAIAVFAGPLIVERIRRKKELRNQHLKKIKDIVLKNILAKLEKYLCNLKKRTLNLSISSEARIETSDLFFALPDADFTLLYSCFKEEHFPILASSWEAFQVRVEQYLQKRIDFCNRIADLIIKKGGKISSELHEYLNERHNYVGILSIHVFARLTNFTSKSLRALKKTGNDTEINNIGVGNYHVALPYSTETIETSLFPGIEEVINLLKSDKEFIELSNLSEQLCSEGENLKGKLIELNYYSQLPGRCPILIK